jgi:hypothetical protein
VRYTLQAFSISVTTNITVFRTSWEFLYGVNEITEKQSERYGAPIIFVEIKRSDKPRCSEPLAYVEYFNEY